MPPKNFPQDTEFLSPAILPPQEEYKRGIHKADQKLKDHLERSQKELEASDIFGHVFNTWKPGSKKLLLLYQRQSVSVNAKTALTASKMTTQHLERLGRSFDLLDPFRRVQKTSQPARGASTDIESAVSGLRKELESDDSSISLPLSMRRQSVNELQINSESDVNQQFIRLLGSLFILACLGKIKDESPKANGDFFSFKDGKGVPITPEIKWEGGGTAKEPLTSHALSLGVLFTSYDVEKASSELVVERTVGSYFQTLFDGIGDGAQITSGQQLLMFGPLTAFGSNPEPDLVARFLDAPHRFLSPVCLVGEAKTEDTHDNRTVAQLATAAHSTLALFIIAWCLKNREAKFPQWAYILGIAYTEKRVAVHAFYPQGGLTSTESSWHFRSTEISRYPAIGSLTPILKLRFMHAMKKVQEHSRDFGINMKRLLKQVFVLDHENGVKINSQVISSHPSEERAKIERIRIALKESLKTWDKIIRA